MDLTAPLNVARDAAEALMTTSCTITRDDPDAPRGDMDPVTLQYPDPVPLTVYEGPCKVQENRVQVSDATSGDRQAGVLNREVHLPVGAPGSGDVRRDDDVTITAAPHDPALVGRVFVVRGPHAGSLKTARRLPVEEVL